MAVRGYSAMGLGTCSSDIWNVVCAAMCDRSEIREGSMCRSALPWAAAGAGVRQWRYCEGALTEQARKRAVEFYGFFLAWIFFIIFLCFMKWIHFEKR